MKQRLDKILASQGLYSRSEARQLVRNGRVKINGTPAKSADEKANPEADDITVDGVSFTYREYVYIMLNKPQGVVSASESPGDVTVVDLVPPSLKRSGLFPAGRLDKDTTGFVLITDDGSFAHDILSPKKHIVKTYHAELSNRLSDEEQKRFADGVTLADGYECLPAFIRELSEDGKTVEIKLREGKYHQIKRMAAACGTHVVRLHRVAMGSLTLDESLGEGECRLLSEEEKKRITES
ncbi:MAG TPA: 16S rRNA pseudouridine(516) synthase [Ruminococcaceae bacterium]|nr:16S rRNA pseudouridine(516) synthase [Oscillospiraceae bacterium]